MHPQTLETSGGNQQGPAGATLDEPFVVVVRDQNGDLLAGVQVAFTVTAGGGTLSSATATTNANGRATTTLTLGSEPGTNTVEASVEGLESVTFTAVGYANPHSLEKIAGDGQEGPASTQLAEPLVVAVADEDGAVIAGVVVSFAVTAGGGTLSSATATTDANGRATTRLTLGSNLGTNTVEASVTGLEPETFTATATEQAIPYSLAKVRGEDQEGAVGTQLAEPLVVAVADEDGAAIAGVAVSFAVTAGGGTLSATTATTNADGRARSYLTLGSELGTNTVEVSVEGLESVTFTATGQESPLVSLFDAFLNGSGKLVGLARSSPIAAKCAQSIQQPDGSFLFLANSRACAPNRVHPDRATGGGLAPRAAAGGLSPAPLEWPRRCGSLRGQRRVPVSTGDGRDGLNAQAHAAAVACPVVHLRNWQCCTVIANVSY